MRETTIHEVKLKSRHGTLGAFNFRRLQSVSNRKLTILTEATRAPTPGTVSSRLAMGNLASSFETIKFAPAPMYEAARSTVHRVSLLMSTIQRTVHTFAIEMMIQSTIDGYRVHD